ncbi:MAG: serine/threonine protein kinase [Acidobacteria bacterium]|nr:serine/threonine protein kinase [Acidobacteriota bacterium]
MDTAPQGKIGRYVVQGELGRGAMGVVYRAQDPAIGRTVAVKTIRIGQFNDEREIKHVQDRMMREAQAAGILSHNNIVTIYDIQHEEGTAYIFMEFVDGETLEKMLLADTPIDKQLILHILKQAAEALDYAHQRGIIHRDVKPANIMVRRDGVAKIADFGIARMQSHQFTQTGQILGTPNYMSPEQISGRPVDGRADQYSLAVILYEVLTGEKPFVADSLPTLLFRVVSEAPQPAPRLNPTLSAAIDEVLQRALSKSPADRFPSCSEFVRTLERACQNAPGWTTLVRGGGLSQPTNVGPVPQHHQPAPKHIDLPHQEPAAPRPAAQPAAPAPAKKPVIPPAQPVRTAQRPRTRAKQGINMMAVLATALAAALVGAVAIGYKLVRDKQQQQQQIARVDPAPAKPADPEPIKPIDPKPSALPNTGPPKTIPQNTQLPKSADPPKPADPKPNTGALMAVAIRTAPEGAHVVLDEGKLPPCTTPCLLELPSGRHTAALMLDTYKTEMRIFYVPQDASVNVTLEKRKGMLEISSTPQGATVSIDGVEHPHKTPVIIPVVVGKHTVVVTLPGKPPYTQTFEMRSEATISLQPTWAN